MPRLGGTLNNESGGLAIRLTASVYFRNRQAKAHPLAAFIDTHVMPQYKQIQVSLGGIGCERHA
jgi:hypothetical protein